MQLIHPVYFLLTLVTGAYRVRSLTSDGLLVDLWDNSRFVALSYLQKLGDFSELLVACRLRSSYSQSLLIVAVPYYVLNIRAAFKLEDPIFFNKEAWIALVNQVWRVFKYYLTIKMDHECNIFSATAISMTYPSKAASCDSSCLNYISCANISILFIPCL